GRNQLALEPRVSYAATLMHRYEIRPHKDHRGVDLISDALPFGRLWFGEPNAATNAVGHAKHRRRSHDAAIRVYDEAINVIETHEHAGDFRQFCCGGRPGVVPGSRRALVLENRSEVIKLGTFF